ncbi:MAG: hypothetical protein KDJ86_00010 [Bauldia sp.]|uniref:hypothetical protein n=1 Tax=Bauldia sp. TaxID=2575872 RepID=UPI001E07810F|nr:hypothetical protein [Bauldia sp.]MCB1494139.1 hypothetical protein [Bauldia sp.]
MASDLGRTILLLPENDPADERPAHLRAAAFLPISVALFGVAMILVGGLSVTPPTVAEKAALDPIATGSIARVPAE